MRLLTLVLLTIFPVFARGEVILSNLGKTSATTVAVPSSPNRSVAFAFNATGVTNLSSVTLRFYNAFSGFSGSLVRMVADISLRSFSATGQGATSLVNRGGNFWDASFDLTGASTRSGANTLLLSNIYADGDPYILHSSFSSVANGWDINTTDWSGFGSAPSSSGNMLQISISAVPEPGTLLLYAGGLVFAGISVLPRLKKARASINPANGPA